MSDFTTFLFARPSFVEGVARILDLGGTLQEYNQSATGVEADHLALTMDMYAIGQDMRIALNLYAASNEGALEPQE
jgi:hypothetical protein